MPDVPKRQRRTYEQMVRELHAFVGSRVAVEVTLLMSRATRPLVTIIGRLESAQAADMATEIPRFPSGESILFYCVGSDQPDEFSCFVLSREGYKLGFKTADETLTWQSGQALFVVWLDLTRRPHSGG